MGQWLGEGRATARIGQPLQFSATARLDAADTGQACTSADVFYGERQLASSQLRLDITGSGAQRQIRIDGLRPVDEPFVTVVVRVGCRDVVTRRYDLLPDSPFAQAPVVSAGPSVPSGSAVPAAPAAPAVASSLALPQAVVPPSPVVRRRVPARTPQPPARPRGPVLRVEPLDLEPVPSSGLRLSTGLAAPDGDPGRRANAALWWQALNSDAEQVVQTLSRLRVAEQEMAALRRETGRVQAELAALTQRERAESRGLPVASVLGLLLLLLCACVGALVLRHRGARQDGERPAWREEPVAGPTRPGAPDRALPVPDVEELVRPRPLRAPTASLLPVSVLPVAGSPRVDALLHVLQEVEFLVMLHQPKRAIESLEHYLAAHVPPSPLVFLAWMELGYAEEDALLVERAGLLYVDTFGCEPPQTLLLDPGWGVERHASILAELAHAWNTPRLPGVIEKLLFAMPRGPGGLSLQAGRDLLFLYELDMAKRVDAPRVHAPAAIPVAAALRAEPELASGAQASGFWSTFPPDDVRESSWIGFDVDLDALERDLTELPRRSGPTSLASGLPPLSLN